MATIKDILQKDKIAAWKGQDILRKEVLGQVLGAIQTAEKSGKAAVEFDDEKVKAHLATEVKKRRESAKIYAEAGAVDRAERETAEADILATYLPTQLTADEIGAIVDEVIAGAGENPNLGKVMGQVMGRVKGQADGAVVRAVVQSKIS